jgi:hypothetical protein
VSEWRAVGELPPFEPDDVELTTELCMDWLTEDILQLTNGRHILDVGWYPCQDPKGDYRALRILDRDWQYPKAGITTRSTEVVRRWLKEQQRRGGGE